MLSRTPRSPILLGFILALLLVVAATRASADSLAWDANTETGIAGYVVSYGFAPGSYVASIDVGNVTTWVLPQFTPGTRYYFAVRAYTTTGAMSGPSNEVSWLAPTQSGPAPPAIVTEPPIEPGSGGAPVYVPPQVVSFGTSAGTRAAAGTPVRLSVTATGGTDPLQFRFWVGEPGRAWRILQDYGASATADFTPRVPGRHRLLVWVRSAGSVEPFEAIGKASLTVTATTLRVEVAADRLMPVAPRVPVTLTATASGTADPVEFKFRQLNASTGAWTTIANYSTNASITWRPETASRHQIEVWARRVGSDARFEARSVAKVFEVATVPARLVSLAVNQQFPLPARSPVTLTAQAAGGSGPLEYQFWRFNAASGTWTVLQPYSPLSSVTWTPGEQDWGQYAFRVWVRSAGSRGRFEASAASDTFEILP